jgi:hypothetical protein
VRLLLPLLLLLLLLLLLMMMMMMARLQWRLRPRWAVGSSTASCMRPVR